MLGFPHTKLREREVRLGGSRVAMFTPSGHVAIGEASLDLDAKIGQDSNLYLCFTDGLISSVARVKYDLPPGRDVSVILDSLLRSLNESVDVQTATTAIKSESGRAEVVYEGGGGLQSVALEVTHQPDGRPALRKGSEVASSFTLHSASFDPNNIFGLPQLISLQGNVVAPLRAFQVDTPVGLFTTNGCTRYVLTPRGLIADPLLALSIRGEVVKTWRNRLDFSQATSKLTFYVAFLDGFARDSRVKNPVFHVSGILEIKS